MTTTEDRRVLASPPAANGGRPRDPRTLPPWERSTFRFWFWSITAIAVMAVMLAVVAVAIARPQEGGEAAPSGATAAAPKSSIDFAATPGADFTARDPKAPPPASGTVHQIRLEAEEAELEIAPGVKQMMWSFGGEVPGPTFRGKVGDTFEFTLVNKGTNSHSIDFHASMVAPNVEMRSIAPGESLVYRFTAKHSGMFMYHCGTPAVLHHVGNGMYGAIIIDPPDLAPVDHEYVMVQSELYPAPKGEPASYEKMLAKQWDAVVFNGYVNQYQHRPIRVEPNQRIRVWVLDAGPSESASFHVIGTIFDTAFKEGAYTLRGGATTGGAQALDLQPAQGGFVEFTFDVPGLYPFLTHNLADASQGGLGVFQAGDVPDAEGGAAH